MTQPEEFLAYPQFVDICENIKSEQIEYPKLCANLHLYMKNYLPDGPKAKWSPKIILKILNDVQKKLETDTISPQLTNPLVVFGPIYGEGDSLVNLMAIAGAPPDVCYVMLGCYTGNGFAPIECLMFVFALKILYPQKVILLKGHLEESIAIEMMKSKKWLQNRGILDTIEVDIIYTEIKKSCSLLLPMVFLNPRTLCMPGGPGPMLRQHGVTPMFKMKRPPKNSDARKLFMEEASEFCKANNITCLIRGRQMVEEGYLNKPAEMITLLSAVAYLDNFRNYAAVLKIDGEKVKIMRYKMEEGEQASLELIKPGAGRNALY